MPRSPHIDKKHKRRRESGLLLPRRGTLEWEDDSRGRLTSEGVKEIMKDEIKARNKGKEKVMGIVKVKDTAAQVGSLEGSKGTANTGTAFMTSSDTVSVSRGGLSSVGEEGNVEGELNCLLRLLLTLVRQAPRYHRAPVVTYRYHLLPPPARVSTTLVVVEPGRA